MKLAARIGKAVAASVTVTTVAGALLAGTAGAASAATAAPRVCHTKTVHIKKTVRVHGHQVRRPATTKVRVCTAQHHTTPVASSPGATVPTNAHWASGAWPGGSIDATAANAFATYRGRALDMATIYQVRDSWDTIAHSTWAEDQYKGFTGTLVIGVPMVPDGNGSGVAAGTLADVAAGQHDADFASFAHNLVTLGRGDSVLRIGWEFDGTWTAWAATDANTYKAAFRRIVGVIRGIAPAVTIDWTGDLGGSQVGADDFTQLYPGDDVVDYVGVDAYDRQWYAVTNDASWNSYLSMSYGLNAWKAFAVAHGKKVSVPEWGLYSTETGDSAFYIHKMHDWFAANAGVLAYESYFNEPQDYIANSLTGPVQNPQASAEYRALWSVEG